MDSERNERTGKTIHSLPADNNELYHLPHPDVTNVLPVLFHRHHTSSSIMYGSLCHTQLQVAHQHPSGRMRNARRRIARLQFPFLFQSSVVPLRLHFIVRHTGYSPHFLSSTHFIGSYFRIYGRNVLWSHRNFVYLKKNNINPLNLAYYEFSN